MVLRLIRIAVATAAVGLLASCGGPGAPLGPPSAKDILSKPLHTNLNDAHFVVSGKDKDGNQFDGWIRESDGYPVKYEITQQGNALTLNFDKYNTGESITAPPASQVVQG